MGKSTGSATRAAGCKVDQWGKWISLGAGEACWVDGVRGGNCIQAVDGLIWVTASGDIEDHILPAGEKLKLAKPGRLVVQALREPATFQIGALC
jgi:hypothetical protein